MRLIIELDCGEDDGEWVASGAEFTPLSATFGTGATVPAALRDLAGCLEEYVTLLEPGEQSVLRDIVTRKRGQEIGG